MSFQSIVEHFAKIHNVSLDLINSSKILRRFQRIPTEELELKGKGLDTNFATIGFKVQVSNAIPNAADHLPLPFHEDNMQN